jgi:hypothetical protein
MALHALVLASGCDAMLRLEHVSKMPLDAVGGGDGDGDGGVVACSVSSRFTSPTLVTMTMMSEASVSDAPSSVIAYAYQDSVYAVGLMTGSTTLQRVANNANHPALVRDGSMLLFYAVGTDQVGRADFTGTSFGSPGPAVGLDTYQPGTAAVLGQTFDMVAFSPTSSGFQEVRSVNRGAWQIVGMALQPADIDSDGTISYPSLSADGLTLVYVQTGGTHAGVNFAHRPNSAVGFDQHDATGLILDAAVSVVTSPVLSADCSSLFAVDVATQHLVVFTP